MSPAAPKPAAHRWSFYRAGGVDQVRLDSGADILNLGQLDQKLWVALSCPTRGLEIDERTLTLLDTDGDGRVRPPELLAAVAWLRDVLVNPDTLVPGRDGVELANIRRDTDEGRALAASAQHILKSLGRTMSSICVADTAAMTAALAGARLNGDGIVPPESIEEPAARALATEVIACVGGVPDRSGKPGYDAARLASFFEACAAHAEWNAAAERDAARVLPFGDKTPAAYTAFTSVRAKVDDYFGRCRMAAYDPRALAAVNREEAAYVAAAAKDLTISADEIAPFPLALAGARKPLPLTEGVNPAWGGAVARFRTACCPDTESLSEEEWAALCARLEPHAAWLAAKGGAAVERLGAARVREILAGDGRAALQRAIDEDLSVAGEIGALARVEKLTHLHRDLHTLLTNYVNFADFYARRGAIFQAGTLFLDGRACDMCFRVGDAARVAKMAPMSNSFLVFVDCTRPGVPGLGIVCAITAGDSDNLFEGRNGVFYDRKGVDWDATITKVVVNPISVRQGFWSPYKRVMRGIQEAVAKKAAAADEAAAARLATGVASAAEGGTKPAAGSGAQPTRPKFDVGTIAALGVAVSGIAGVFTALLTGFLGLGLWIPFGIIGLLLAISGPAMFIAWVKLRTRNLGPILDANGWAVNTLTRVNIPLGGSMTLLPRIPAGAKRSLVDPYAPRRSRWPRVVLALLLSGGIGWALYQTNHLHRWFPEYVPAHHTELDLTAAATAGVPGDTLEFAVASKAASLQVTDVTNRAAPVPREPLDVKDGKAVLAIPADAKPGTWTVLDAVSGTSVEVSVTAK